MSFSGFALNTFKCSCSPRKEVTPLSLQQSMKYGSSPSYFECELTVDFFLAETAPGTSVEKASPTDFPRTSSGADIRELQPLPKGQHPISASKCISVLPLSWVPRGFWSLNHLPALARRPFQAPTAMGVPKTRGFWGFFDLTP